MTESLPLKFRFRKTCCSSVMSLCVKLVQEMGIEPLRVGVLAKFGKKCPVKVIGRVRKNSGGKREAYYQSQVNTLIQVNAGHFHCWRL